MMLAILATNVMQSLIPDKRQLQPSPSIRGYSIDVEGARMDFILMTLLLTMEEYDD
jgi:hypothetical protein